MANSVKDIEKAIALLPTEQLRQFRAWYEKFDSNAWDKQKEEDAANEKHDSLAKAAIADHNAGKSKEI